MTRPPTRLATISAFALAVLGSCTLLDTSPLTVISWSPRDEQPATLDGAVIQIRFSRAVNAALTEQAFSITADSVTLSGRVTWPDYSTLLFTPHEPLRDFVVYRMSVSSQAEDAQGRDLQPPFYHTFTTRTDFSRPVVVSSSPLDHASVTDLLTPLSVTFSKGMDPSTVYSAFSVSPLVTGFFSVSPDGTVFTYTPTRQLQWQTRYTLTVAKSASDRQRNSLGVDFTTHFSVGTDLVPPAISSVQNADTSISLVPDNPTGSLTITQGWEATDGLRVSFTEPVLTTSALSALTLSPSVAFKVQESNAVHTSTLTYSFPDRLAYGTTYTVFAGAGIQDAQGNKTAGQAAWHFIVNGPDTRPPVISRVFFPSTPGDPSSNVALAAYDAIALPPIATPTDTFFDLYIDHAAGSALDPFVVSQSFSVSVTNGAADISSFAVRGNPAQVSPAVTGTEQVTRVWVHITNHVSSGQVVIRVSTALTDSRGTALANEFILPLNDTN